MGSLKLYKLEHGVIVYDPSTERVIYARGVIPEYDLYMVNWSRKTGEVQVGDAIELTSNIERGALTGGELVKLVKEISQEKYEYIKSRFDKQKRAYDTQVERIMQETKSKIEDLKKQEEERINKLAKPTLEFLLERD